MSRHRRGRITVQSQPTGAARAVRRMTGVVQVIFGLVFVIVSITQIIPTAGFIGLPFLAAGSLSIVVGVFAVVGKNSLSRRVGYDVETGIENETIAGLLDDVDSGKQEQDTVSSSGQVETIGPPAKTRLEQLQALKTAGLITPQEYEQKRQEILRSL